MEKSEKLQNGKEVIPFPFIGLKEMPSIGFNTIPEGYYDEEEQVWKSKDGKILDYSLTRAGKETTWEDTPKTKGSDPDPREDWAEFPEDLIL